MGIVNASPDSFSDGGMWRTLEQQIDLARSLLAAGAEVIDIGGESGVTNHPAVDPGEEIARVVPLIDAIAGGLEALVSIDTYKAPVAEAAIAAGAAIVNDPSGLHDPALADVCAQTGAALIVTHTRAAPKQKLLDPGLDGRVLDDVIQFLDERISFVTSRGVAFEQLLLDPGPDLSKTPAQTVEVLRGLRALHSLKRPLLLAVSRKDFVGAITARPPRARLAGTLAAIAQGTDAGAHVVRVHDIAQTVEFMAVRAALRGEAEVDSDLRLSDELRWDQGSRPGGELSARARA
jgi:dihydropteroate synthase